MKTFELSGFSRTDLGKKATVATRTGGNIPAVLYGGDKMETVHFYVSYNSILKLVYSPEVFIVDLTIDGKTQKAILKDLQFHPVKDNVLHLDFVRIFEDKPTTIEIPVILDGLAKGVKAGGKIALELRKLRVKGLYNSLPEKLHIDVTKLALGSSIQVLDLKFENLELLNAANAVVCRVHLTRAAKGSAAAAAGADDDDDEESESESEEKATESAE